MNGVVIGIGVEKAQEGSRFDSDPDSDSERRETVFTVSVFALLL